MDLLELSSSTNVQLVQAPENETQYRNKFTIKYICTTFQTDRVLLQRARGNAFMGERHQPSLRAKNCPNTKKPFHTNHAKPSTNVEHLFQHPELKAYMHACCETYFAALVGGFVGSQYPPTASTV
jgi:hypothetical protein